MTTLRYMHLSPSARKSAISLLNTRAEEEDFGEIVETGGRSTLSVEITATPRGIEP
jgi:hypothetical protein